MSEVQKTKELNHNKGGSRIGNSPTNGFDCGGHTHSFGPAKTAYTVGLEMLKNFAMAVMLHLARLSAKMPLTSRFFLGRPILGWFPHTLHFMNRL